MASTAGSQTAQRRKAALAEGGSEYMAKRAELVRLAAVVFREKGYRTATLNDVAARFGTDRASLYYYFGSKEELFQECVKGILDNNLAAGLEIASSDASPREKLSELVHLVLRSYEEHYPYFSVFIQEDMSHIMNDDDPWAKAMLKATRRLERIFIELIQQGAVERTFRSDIPPVLMANGLFGMLMWTHRWYAPGKSHNTADIAEFFTSIFFDGVDVR